MVKPAMAGALNLQQGCKAGHRSCTWTGSSPAADACWLFSASIQSEIKIPLPSTAPACGQKWVPLDAIFAGLTIIIKKLSEGVIKQARPQDTFSSRGKQGRVPPPSLVPGHQRGYCLLSLMELVYLQKCHNPTSGVGLGTQRLLCQPLRSLAMHRRARGAPGAGSSPVLPQGW